MLTKGVISQPIGWLRKSPRLSLLLNVLGQGSVDQAGPKANTLKRNILILSVFFYHRPFPRTFDSHIFLFRPTVSSAQRLISGYK